MHAQYVKLEQLRLRRNRLREELDKLNALPENEREECREERLELATRFIEAFERHAEYQQLVHRCEQLEEMIQR
jgi:hypothetical protein